MHLFIIHIGNLSFLRFLDLREINGQKLISWENSNRVKQLFESRMVSLSRNNLTGIIPFEFGSLRKLTDFYVERNKLVGRMPSFLTNFSSISLIELGLGINHFHGEIKNSLQGLSNLAFLSLASNNLSGSISPLYNLSSLHIRYIYANHFTGTLARDISVAFSKATFFSFSDNEFTGTIPSSLSNISGLTILQISENSLTGRVPDDLGKLRYLKMLKLGVNLLGSDQPNDLSFLDSLTNCTELERLILGKNKFSGPLPDSVANLLGIFSLQMGGNYITGHIPQGIGELSGSALASFSLFVIVCVFFRDRRRHKKDGGDNLTQGYKRITYTTFRGNRGLCRIQPDRLDYKEKDFKARVFEFMSNGSLHNWLHSGDRNGETTRVLNLAKRLEIAIDVFCALDYLHNDCETPIIHCDIKPSDILLDDDLVAHVSCR
uniref:Protein kinase domain-containing protein n=1 Tax=Kalanchoe fedtschenkoi TaxID=63787 RepID=A0A7N0SVK0_KALFE